MTFVAGNTFSSAEQLHMSPSQGSVDDEASLDSPYAGVGELNDALNTAREKHMITRALDYLTRMQCTGDLEEPPILKVERSLDFEEPIIQEEHIPFHFELPRPRPHYFNDYVCECASRLLLMSLQWARSIPAFDYLT